MSDKRGANPTCDGSDCNKLAVSTCTGCRSKHYCSAPCQKAAWEEHSYECSPMPPLSYDSLPSRLTKRPKVSTAAGFEKLLEEVKSTYYGKTVSNDETTQHKNGVPQGFIVIKNGGPQDAMVQDFTKAQLNRHIIFIMTKKREKVKKRFVTAIVGKTEADMPGTIAFGGELATQVSSAYHNSFLPAWLEASNMRYKFDLLYGFTGAIYQYWFWMQRHPHDWNGHGMLEQLAKFWKRMLCKKPEELGLDPVFSFPAMTYFCRKFKKDVEEESCSCPRRLLFNFE